MSHDEPGREAEGEAAEAAETALLALEEGELAPLLTRLRGWQPASPPPGLEQRVLLAVAGDAAAGPELLERLRRWRPAAPAGGLEKRVLAAVERGEVAPELAARVALRCGYCHAALAREAGVFCAACLAPHHAECWDAHGGCTAPGCGEARVVRPEPRSQPQGGSEPRPRRLRRGRVVRWAAGVALLGSLPVAALALQLGRGAAAPDQGRARQALAEAREHRARGEHRGALEALRQALDADPGLGEAYLLRAESLRAIERPREAEEAFARAIELAPRDGRAWRGRAELRAGLGYRDEALGDLARALELDPRAVDALLLQARLLVERGRSEEALQALDRALALTPDRADALLRRAWLVVERGRDEARLPQALADASRLIALRPDQAEGHRLRAALRARRGDLPGAEQDLARACALDGPGVEAWSARLGPDARSACTHGQVLLLLGRPAEACAAFDLALSRQDDLYPAYLGRGRAHAALGRWGEASQDLNEAIDLNPALPEAYYFRAEAYAAQGKLSEAYKDYELALTRDPDMGQARLALAGLLSRIRDDERARQGYLELIARALATGHRQLAAEAHLGLAELARITAEPTLCRVEARQRPESGDGAALLAARRREARDRYQAALALEPDLPRARLGRARLSWQEGDLSGARADLEALLQRPGQTDAALRARAQALLGLVHLGAGGDLLRAEQAFRQARLLDPGLALALAGLGQVALARGEREQARELLATARTSLAAEPEETGARTARPREAHRGFAALVSEDPLQAPAWLGWTELLLAQQAWDEARTLAERALQVDPFLAEAHLALGQAWLRRAHEAQAPAAGADPEAARAALDQAVSLGRGETLAAALQARALTRWSASTSDAGQLELAAEDLLRAQDVALDLALTTLDGAPLRAGPLRRALACLEALARLEEQRGRPAAAREAGARAEALRERARAAAELLVEEGRRQRDRLDYAGAIRRFGLALELAPDRADAHYDRGTCQLKLGQFVPGVLDFARAMELDPRIADQVYHRTYQTSGGVDLDRVLGEMDRIVADHPGEAHVVFLRGFYWLAKTELRRHGPDDVAAGLRDMEAALALNPRFVAARLYRGILRHKAAGAEAGPEAREAAREAALQDWAAALELDPGSGLAPFLQAGCWSQRSGDEALPAERRAEARRQALAALQLAFRRGFKGQERLLHDRAFDPLRADPAVQALLR